ncbi:lysosome-associated membrane glycoprotein 2 [Melanotaenia boesemani]|uniref:lysosome-associated membrane glycoprotein 2 n=1 Tax=Melanotaenia boesemani TaxID=1250792 RepID=UPI001C03F4A9|nr:lysosome-associated membrane glycoprotein 2 [Melanotaenia boesemani]
MVLNHHTSGWYLFFLAAFIPGVYLQRNDSSIEPVLDSELPSGAEIYRPVLQPSETVATPETYMLKNPLGMPCIKATMGAEYIVTESKKTWYFNLEPSRVRISGSCGKEVAVLILTLPNNASSLQFTFRKENKVFYVTDLTAHLFPQPVCKGCFNKTYSGVMGHENLFETANGQSFKCKSGFLLLASSELKIKLVPLQIQAFSIPKGQYGKEVECLADHNKRIIPIITGSIVVGVILIIVLSFLLIRERRRQGYARL